MAFNGAGVFSRLYNWVQDKNNSIKIRADKMDAEMDGFATGLSAVICRDGTSTITADIPMSSHKLTGLSAGAASGDSVRYEQVFSGASKTAEATVPSAATCDILGATSDLIAISGVVTITSFGTGTNKIKFVRATGAFIITHNATSLICPGGANILTASGDTFVVQSDASSNARIISYKQANGAPIIASSDSGAGIVTGLSLYRASSTAADEDAGLSINFDMNDAAQVRKTMAMIYSSADPDATFPAGYINFSMLYGVENGGLVTTPSHVGPIILWQYDPGGSVIGATNAVIETFGANDEGYGDGLNMNFSSGTIDSPVIPGNGDDFGYIGWKGWSAAQAHFVGAAYIAGGSDGVWDSGGDTTDTPTKIRFYTCADGAGTALERLRLSGDGTVRAGTLTGFGAGGNRLELEIATGNPLALNRTGNDGTLIKFYQDGSLEGFIDVSGTTVALTGAHLTRWSQWLGAPQNDLPRGTIVSNVDEMCSWKEITYTALEPGDFVENKNGKGKTRLPTKEISVTRDYSGENDIGETDSVLHKRGETYTGTITLSRNDQLNKIIVSNVAGDINVAGLLEGYDEDGEPKVAQSGDYVIRINKDYTVKRGDLIESNGDGTGRIQSDDIIRSRTVAKIASSMISRIYDDGSYLVPCIIICGG